MSWWAIMVIVGIAPIAFGLSISVWEYDIRPRLIPARRLDAMVDLMLATFGPFAEHEAFLRQREAWHRGDGVAQGVWRRIRARLRRRWRRGEAVLYDGPEVEALRRAERAIRNAGAPAARTAPPPARRPAA